MLYRAKSLPVDKEPVHDASEVPGRLIWQEYFPAADQQSLSAWQHAV